MAPKPRTTTWTASHYALCLHRCIGLFMLLCCATPITAVSTNLVNVGPVLWWIGSGSFSNRDGETTYARVNQATGCYLDPATNDFFFSQVGGRVGIVPSGTSNVTTIYPAPPSVKSYGLTTSSDSTTLYIAEFGYHSIRKLSLSDYSTSIFAGAGTTTAGSTNGVGTAASFNQPIALLRIGSDLYVGEGQGYKIRKVSD